MCEHPRAGICGGTDFLLSKHELAQERLYRMWRAGWVREENVLLWAQRLERLQREDDCDSGHFTWRHLYVGLSRAKRASGVRVE